MKDKLRDLAERWKAYARTGCGGDIGEGRRAEASKCANELLSILDAEGDGEMAAEVYEGAFGVHYIGCADPSKLPVGTKLYTAPPASPAGVPDGLLEHLREALRRVENGHSPRRIPANPGDVDLALSEAIAWLEGMPAPFWVKPAAADKLALALGDNP